MFACCAPATVVDDTVTIPPSSLETVTIPPGRDETVLSSRLPAVEEQEEEHQNASPEIVVKAITFETKEEDEPEEKPDEKLVDKKEEEKPVEKAVVKYEKAKEVVTRPLVELLFSTESGHKRVRVEQRPLGVRFGQMVPMTVVDVRKEFAGGVAGIKKGSRLLSVNGEDVSVLSRSFDATMAILQKHMQQLPEANNGTGLDIVVLDADGKDMTLRAQWSPLGVEFERKVPITVASAKAGSYGLLLGVRAGMVFKSVGEEDLSKCETYEEAMAIVKRSVGSLPVLSQTR